MPETAQLARLPVDETDLLIKTIIHTDQSPEAIISSEIDNDTLIAYGKRLGRDLATALAVTERIRPCMGRVLLLCKQRPELWRDMGYRIWDDWMSIGVAQVFGIPRSDAYDLCTIAEELPHLTIPELKELGIKKLKIASQIIRKSNKGISTIEMKRANADKWVALAKENTSIALKTIAVEQSVVDASDVEPKVPLSFHVSPTFKTQFEEFENDVDIRQKVMQEYGKFDDEALLTALVEEASTWKAEIADQTRNVVAAE